MNKVEEALGLFLDSLPSNDEWWCPYCGTTGCTFNGRCDKCGTPIEENQPDTTMVESLHEALTALRSGELVVVDGAGLLEIIDVLSDAMGDSDPDLIDDDGDEMSDSDIRMEYPLIWVCQHLTAYLQRKEEE